LVDSRRSQILDAAIGLFVRRGYHPTTVKDIARAAGLSIGTVYLYFPSKDSILEFGCERVLADFSALARDEGWRSKDPAEALASAFREFVGLVDQTSDLHLIIYRESSALDRKARRRITDFELGFRQLFSELLERGIAAGRFTAHDTVLRAQTIVFLAHMWALKRWWLQSYTTPEDYAREQLRLLLGDASVIR